MKYVSTSNSPEWLSGLSKRLQTTTSGADEFYHISDWITSLFSCYCVDNGLTVYAGQHYGTPVIDFHKSFEKFGTSICEKYSATKLIGDVRYSKTGIFKIQYSGNEVTASWITSDREESETFRKFVKDSLSATSEGGIYAITRSPRGFSLSNIGSHTTKLIRENYSDEVMERYDMIIKDINNPEPTGRLSILDGPPGTGKTHLIKGLISDPEAQGIFVVISPDIIPELTGPALLPLLVQVREDEFQGKKPLIFIVEDADSILTPRVSGNMSSISALLNYTDGIFGSLFNIRVLCTTNQPKFEIDDALLRAGRLSVAVTVGPLEADKANEIYCRLSKEEFGPFTEPTILADVYAKAKGVKKKEKKAAPKMGFT